MLFALYAAGILSALAVSWVMKKWRRDKSEHALMLELPSYRMPHPRDLLIGLWERAMIFLKRVGGIILALTILLWFLLSFPGAPADATVPAIDYSFAGRIGHAMTRGVRAARLQLADLHRADPGHGRARSRGVVAGHGVCAVGRRRRRRRAGTDADHQRHWSLATALSLLVWYIYAPQCLSTLATIRRETNSWKQVAISAGYLFALAYLASL